MIKRTALHSLLSRIFLMFVAILATVASPRSAQAALQAVGPVQPANGFPQYYQDASGLALSQCLDNNGLCALAMANTLDPVAFPTNFPLEFFYWGATSVTPTNNGGQALIDLSLTGSFSTLQVLSGDQIVFARVRVRIDNLVAGATYKVTHPFGTDSFVALGSGARGINRTIDIGLCPGDFAGALAGRIGPFLVWNPAESAPPAGYVGDPNVLHTVLGSPFGSNYVRIEGPNVGGPGINVIENNRFSVVGKLESGPVPAPVSPQRASYTRTALGSAISVFVDSVASASLTATGVNVPATVLNKDALTGKFFAHIGLAAGVAVPTTLNIQNVAQAGAVAVPVVLADQIIISQAVYDPISQQLRVDAASGDLLVPPALTLAGVGVLPATGSLVVGAYAPPAIVTVTSSNGGRAQGQVAVIPGAVPSNAAPTANAGLDQVVASGTAVVLAGTLNGYGTATLAWSQLAGPAVTLIAGPATGVVTFTAPTVTTTTNLTFRLTATSFAGVSTDDVIVTVAGPTTKAIIQAVAPVVLGSTVTLDGSASTGGVSTWAWTQTAGPAVTLTGANTSKASFVFPATAVVGQPNGIATLQFKLTVSGPNGTSFATINVSNQPSTDILTATQVQYRTKKQRWDIAGTATITTANAVTAYLGPPSLNRPIGKVSVPSTGAWVMQILPSTVIPITGEQVYLVSDKGGQLGGLAVTITAN